MSKNLAERLAFIPIAVFVVLLGYWLKLEMFGFLSLLGAGIAILALLFKSWDRFGLTLPLFSYLGLSLGVIFLVLAFFAAEYHGVSMAMLAHDKSFPRFVRRAYDFAVVFLSFGCTLFLAVLWQHSPFAGGKS